MRSVVIVAGIGAMFFIGLQLGAHLLAQFTGAPAPALMAAPGGGVALGNGVGGQGL